MNAASLVAVTPPSKLMLCPAPEPEHLRGEVDLRELRTCRSRSVWNGPVSEAVKLADWLPEASTERLRLRLPLVTFVSLLNVSFRTVCGSSLELLPPPPQATSEHGDEQGEGEEGDARGAASQADDSWVGFGRWKVANASEDGHSRARRRAYVARFTRTAGRVRIVRHVEARVCGECGAENPGRRTLLHVVRRGARGRLPALRRREPARREVLHRVRRRRSPAAPAERGAAAGATAEAPPEERRKATVLFADLSGYTAVAERMDPEAVKSMVEGALRRLGDEVGRYGGTIDKYIGDNVMAVFGAPVAHEDDPERAVRAGLAMQAAMEEINDRHRRAATSASRCASASTPARSSPARWATATP